MQEFITYINEHARVLLKLQWNLFLETPYKNKEQEKSAAGLVYCVVIVKCTHVIKAMGKTVAFYFKIN